MAMLPFLTHNTQQHFKLTWPQGILTIPSIHLQPHLSEHRWKAGTSADNPACPCASHNRPYHINYQNSDVTWYQNQKILTADGTKLTQKPGVSLNT